MNAAFNTSRNVDQHFNYMIPKYEAQEGDVDGDDDGSDADSETGNNSEPTISEEMINEEDDL